MTSYSEMVSTDRIIWVGIPVTAAWAAEEPVVPVVSLDNPLPEGSVESAEAVEEPEAAESAIPEQP